MTEGERQRLKRTGCLSSSWLQVQSGAASGARIAALGESKPALTHPPAHCVADSGARRGPCAPRALSMPLDGG